MPQMRVSTEVPRILNHYGRPLERRMVGTEFGATMCATDRLTRKRRGDEGKSET